MAKERKLEWDYIKGILIILVVWGHVCSYISGDGYEKNFLTAAIRLFQMPLFIFVSGVFQHNYSNITEVRYRIISISKRLVLPYAIWIVIAAGFNLLTDRLLGFNNLTLGGGYWPLLKLCFVQSNVLWYLGCLILCEILYCILSWVSGRNRLIVLAITIFLSVLLPKDIWHFPFMWFWFVMGTVWKQMKNPKPFSLKVLIPICIVLLLLAQMFPTKYTFYNFSNCIWGEGQWITHLVIIIGRYICYGIMTIAFMMLIKEVYYQSRNSKITQRICAIGQNTLGIFVIHIIVLYYTLKPFVQVISNGDGLIPDMPFVRYYIIAPIISLTAIIGAYYVSRLIKKSRTLSRILLGQ